MIRLKLTNGSESVSEWVSESVSDMGRLWSDLGPIKITSWSHRSWQVQLTIKICEGLITSRLPWTPMWEMGGTALKCTSAPTTCSLWSSTSCTESLFLRIGRGTDLPKWHFFMFSPNSFVMVNYKTYHLKHYIVFVKICPPNCQITFWPTPLKIEFPKLFYHRHVGCLSRAIEGTRHMLKNHLFFLHCYSRFGEKSQKQLFWGLFSKLSTKKLFLRFFSKTARAM